MHKLKINIILAKLLTAIISGYGQEIKADRPNIIVFLADDMGWGDSGCYGNEKIQYPWVR